MAGLFCGNFQRKYSLDEPQILESLKMMGRIGYCIEPTSAVAVAGAKTYLK